MTSSTPRPLVAEHVRRSHRKPLAGVSVRDEGDRSHWADRVLRSLGGGADRRKHLRGRSHRAWDDRKDRPLGDVLVVGSDSRRGRSSRLAEGCGGGTHRFDLGCNLEVEEGRGGPSMDRVDRSLRGGSVAGVVSGRSGRCAERRAEAAEKAQSIAAKGHEWL